MCGRSSPPPAKTQVTQMLLQSHQASVHETVPQDDKMMCPSPSRLARDKGACRLSSFPAWARKLTRGDVSLLSVGSTFKPQVIAGGFGHPREGTGAGVG